MARRKVGGPRQEQAQKLRKQEDPSSPHQINFYKETRADMCVYVCMYAKFI